VFQNLGLSALPPSRHVGDTAGVDTLRILLVDDDTDAAARLAADLAGPLGPVTVVPDVYQALSLHTEDPFDAVILEVALPGASGIDLLERLVPTAPAVVLTWLVSPAVTARSIEAGAHAVLAKPSGFDSVVAAVRAAVRAAVGARHPAEELAAV